MICILIVIRIIIIIIIMIIITIIILTIDSIIIILEVGPISPKFFFSVEEQRFPGIPGFCNVPCCPRYHENHEFPGTPEFLPSPIIPRYHDHPPEFCPRYCFPGIMLTMMLTMPDDEAGD